MGKLNARGAIYCGPSSAQMEEYKKAEVEGLKLIYDFISGDCIQEGKIYYINGNDVMFRVPSLMSDDYAALRYEVPAASGPLLKVANEEHLGVAKTLKDLLKDKAGINCCILD